MDVPDPDRAFRTLRARLAARRAAVVEHVEATRAAVAVILSPGERGAELLLIRRAECDGDPWSGHMGLPGGRMDAGDADLLATARRETLEELAVELPEAALLGRLDDLHPISRHLPAIVVRPFVFGLPARPAVVCDRREVAYHLWAPATLLAESRGSSLVQVGEQHREMPSFEHEGDVVWGITHRILDPLLDLFD